MAEGKALGKDDLFEKDAFQNATNGAKELLAVIKETQDTIKGSLTAQKEFVSTFKAKSYDDVKKLNEAIAETNTLIKQKEQLTKAEIQIQQQSEKLNQEKLKTQREEIKNSAIIEKQNKATERSLNALNGEYAKGVKQLAEIKKQLKELEFTGRNSGKLFKALSTEFDALNKSVRGAEERVGEFQRNVGNYASGFSPLSNSINQLTREMPAFANSMQTGFMAISNNIPILTDAIGQIKAQNATLRAEGKPTQSVLSQLGSAFFSWGTALSVGVTLLTLYGAEMVNFVASVFTGKKAIELSTESIDENTEALKNNRKAIQELQLEIDGSVEDQLLNDKKLTDLDKRRIQAMNEYNKDIESLNEKKDNNAKKQLEVNAKMIKDEETRSRFLSKIAIKDGFVYFKTREDRIRSSQEEIQIFRATNKQLLGLLPTYRIERKKAGEKLSEEIKNIEKAEYLKRLEEQKKAAAKAKKQAEKDAKDKLEVQSDFIRQMNELEHEIRLNEIAIIEDERKRKEAAITEQYRLDQIEIANRKLKDGATKQQKEQFEKKKAEDLIALEKKYLQALDDLRKEYEDKDEKRENERAEKRAKAAQKAFNEKWKAYQDDIEKQKKANQETLKEMDKLEKAIEARYARKNKLANDYLDRETKANETAIEQQQRLAERGLDNTLAFEKEKAAKLELERKRQQEREVRQQKIFAFYSLFSSYAKTDPNTALQKAIVDTAIAEVVSGSFIDGTESVERDLKGNKVHNGKDGYVIAVDGDERIFNPSQNAKIGNISNDEAAQILHDYQKGLLFNYGSIEQPKAVLLNQNIALEETNTLLRELLSVERNKPVHQTNIDNLGNVINTEIRNGVHKVTTIKRRI